MSRADMLKNELAMAEMGHFPTGKTLAIIVDAAIKELPAHNSRLVTIRFQGIDGEQKNVLCDVSAFLPKVVDNEIPKKEEFRYHCLNRMAIIANIPETVNLCEMTETQLAPLVGKLVYTNLMFKPRQANVENSYDRNYFRPKESIVLAEDSIAIAKFNAAKNNLGVPSKINRDSGSSQESQNTQQSGNNSWMGTQTAGF